MRREENVKALPDKTRSACGNDVFLGLFFFYGRTLREKIEEPREEEDIQKIDDGQNYEREQLRRLGDLCFAVYRNHTYDNHADNEDNRRG